MVESGFFAEFTQEFDKGGLMYPSIRLYNLIHSLEEKFTEHFSCNEIQKESLFDVLNCLKNVELNLVGCSLHTAILTTQIVKFYMITRIYFMFRKLMCLEITNVKNLNF